MNKVRNALLWKGECFIEGIMLQWEGFFFSIKKNPCEDFPGGTVVKNPPANAGDMG